jgi:predicted permease
LAAKTTMDSILKDLTHSVRMLLRTAGLTDAAVAALALGIAVYSAMLSVVNAVLVKPLPYHDPDRIVMFQNTYQGLRIGSAAPVEFNWWRQQGALFEDVSAYAFGVANLTGGSVAEQIPTLQVTARFFRLCGVIPLYGRTFSDADDMPGASGTVVLTHAFWQRRFGGDPGVIGRRITMNGASHEVIGVMRPELARAHIAERALLSGDIEIDTPPDVYLPLRLDPNSVDSGHFFNVAGRLQPGVTVAVADERLRNSYEEYRRTRPNISPEAGFGVQRLQDAIVGGVRRSLVILFGAVSLVLLIACANVANLLLARATVRRQELAIRAALGASRWQIVRQLLTESLMLSLIGGGIGLAAGYAGILAILRLSPGLPRIGVAGTNVELDWRVLGFTLAVSVVTAVFFGLYPALHSSRPDPGAALAAGGHRSGAPARSHRTRALLVVAEIALAVVLMIGAALLVRTFIEMRRVDPGFAARNVLTMRMLPTGLRFVDQDGASRVIDDGLRRIRALPGVEAAAVSCCLPLEDRFYTRFYHPGGPAPGSIAGSVTVSDGYFETFRIPVLRGRTFTERDGSGPPVAIVNETLARQFAPDDPLDSQITIGDETLQIVGVVADARDDALNRDPRPIVYHRVSVVSGANGGDPLVWVIRTRDAARFHSGAIQEQLREATGGLPVASPRTMEDVLSRSTAVSDFNALVLTIFGMSALLLAAIGIYGVTAYAVTQRTQELGIRMALGADARRIRTMVVRHDLRLAVAGVAAGLTLAFWLTRLLSGLLFGVTPWDPQVFVAVPLILVAVTLLTAWWPALRASRVHPMAALRGQ